MDRVYLFTSLCLYFYFYFHHMTRSLRTPDRHVWRTHLLNILPLEYLSILLGGLCTRFWSVAVGVCGHVGREGWRPPSTNAKVFRRLEVGVLELLQPSLNKPMVHGACFVHSHIVVIKQVWPRPLSSSIGKCSFRSIRVTMFWALQEGGHCGQDGGRTPARPPACPQHEWWM